MPESPSLERAPLRARELAALFLLGLVVRLAALSELHGSPWDEVPLGDARFFDEWARHIAGGAWLGDEVFYQAPLYPYALGALYAVFGPVADFARALQCVGGALAGVAVAAGTARFATRRSALIAGVACALYAPAIWYDLQLEKTSFAFALTAGLFYLAVARGERTEARWPLLAGGALGALALLRENGLVLALPLAWAFAREPVGRTRRLALFAAGCAALLAPVALHNFTRGGVPLPTAANSGVNFYIGNGAEADGQYRPLVAGRGHPDHEREDARRIAEDLAGHALSPAGVSAFWFARAWAEIRAEPEHFVRLLGYKLRLLLAPREIMDAVAFEVFQDESVVLRALSILSFGVLFPLALAGWVVARGRKGVALTITMAACIATSIVLFFVVGRFRLGLVPFLLPFAALALVEGWRSARRWPAALVFGAAALLSWWPLAFEGDARATSASNLASELLRREEFAAAESWARRACTADPTSADAAFNLGVALRGQNRLAEAREPFERARQLEPAYEADCLAELGAIAALSGDTAQAREILGRALALDPVHPAALQYLRTLQGGTRSE